MTKTDLLKKNKNNLIDLIITQQEIINDTQEKLDVRKEEILSMQREIDSSWMIKEELRKSIDRVDELTRTNNELVMALAVDKGSVTSKLTDVIYNLTKDKKSY